MSEEQPPKRKRKKRSHGIDVDVRTHWFKTTTVKTSLSSISEKGHFDPRPLISGVLVHANQLRLLVGLVAKHHLFNLMEVGSLDFDPDYNCQDHEIHKNSTHIIKLGDAFEWIILKGCSRSTIS